MLRTDKHSSKRLIISMMLIVLVVIVTACTAILGYHLASRYRDTITDAVNGITAKISGIENDIRSQTEMSENPSEKRE